MAAPRSLVAVAYDNDDDSLGNCIEADKLVFDQNSFDGSIY